MTRTRKGGASRRPAVASSRRRGKGGRRGENQGGGNRSLPLPRRAKPRTLDTRRRRRGREERLQRRARSPAVDVTARPRAGAAPGRAHIPASTASEKAAHSKRLTYESDPFSPFFGTSNGRPLFGPFSPRIIKLFLHFNRFCSSFPQIRVYRVVIRNFFENSSCVLAM